MQENSGITWVKNVAKDIRRFFCNSPRCVAAYFVHGLIIIIPLVVTLWILGWAFSLVDGMLAPVLRWMFGRSIPGLGFIVIISSVILIGYLGKQFGHRKVFDSFEARVIGIPVIGAIYGST